MQTHEVTDQNSRFHVQLRDNKADFLSMNLKHKLWLKIFEGIYLKIFATKTQIKFKQQNLNAGQLNKNKIKQNFTTIWMRYICSMYVLIAIFPWFYNGLNGEWCDGLILIALPLGFLPAH